MAESLGVGQVELEVLPNTSKFGSAIGAQLGTATQAGLGAVKAGAAGASATFAQLKVAAGQAGLGIGEMAEPMGLVGETVGKLKDKWNELPNATAKVAAGAVGLGGVMTGVGALALKIGKPIEEAHVALEQAIKNTGGDYEELAPKIQKSIDKMAGFGHGSADTQTALMKLTTVTGDGSKALSEMGLVSEYAAYKHISLGAAADAVGKQMAGGSKLAKQLGLDTKELTTAHKDLEAAQKADDAAMKAMIPTQEATNAEEEKLATKYGMTKVAAAQVADAHKAIIAARASGDPSKIIDAEAQLGSVLYKTTAGMKMSAVDADALSKARLNLQEKSTTLEQADTKLASAKDRVAASTKKGSLEEQEMTKLHGFAEAQAGTLTGRLEAMKTKIENVAGTMASKWGPQLVKAGPLIMGLGAVMESGLLPALGSAIAATWSFTAALLANPITWIVLLIIGLGVAIYEIVTHWSKVSQWISEFWENLKKWTGEAIGKVLGFFSDLATGAVHWAGEMIAGLGRFLESLPVKMAEWAGMAIRAYIEFYLHLPGWIWDALMLLLHTLEDFIPRALGWAMDLGGQVLSAIGGFFTRLPGYVWDLMMGAGGLELKLLSMIPKLVAAALTIGANIFVGIVSFIGQIPGKLGDLIGAVGKLIADAADGALKAAEHLGSAIWSGFKKGLGLSSPSHLERAMANIVKNVADSANQLGPILNDVNGMIPVGTTGTTTAGGGINIASGAITLDLRGATVDRSTLPALQQTTEDQFRRLLGAIQAGTGIR